MGGISVFNVCSRECYKEKKRQYKSLKYEFSGMSAFKKENKMLGGGYKKFKWCVGCFYRQKNILC